MNETPATDVEIEDAVTEALEGDEAEADEAEADEPEAEEEPAEEESSDDEPPARKPSRGENRIQALANSVKEERTRRETIERELIEIKANQQARQNISYEDQARIRAEKLSLMEPHEKEAFLQKEEIQQLRNEMRATQMHSMDATDKAAYEAKALGNPIYAKHRDAVEKALKTLRSNGNTTTREELLKWVIGHEALSAKPAKANAAKKQAATVRVQAAKGKPASARSDAGTYTGTGKTAAQRLEGVLI
jgi:hypothetical protein